MKDQSESDNSSTEETVHHAPDNVSPQVRDIDDQMRNFLNWAHEVFKSVQAISASNTMIYTTSRHHKSHIQAQEPSGEQSDHYNFP